MAAEYKKSPEIQYPCEWIYTIIGQDEASLRKAAETAITSTSYTTETSRKSRSGKYTSLKIRCIVQSEEEREGYFNALSKEGCIKFVL